MDYVICDVCGEKMKSRKKKMLFRCRQESFHLDVLTWRCTTCGFEKIGTCDTHIKMNDGKGPAVKEPVRKPKPHMYNKPRDKKSGINLDWIEYMFKRHPMGFPCIYKRVVPYNTRQKYELRNVKPKHRAILNDVLYDTDHAEMFYTRDYVQNDGLIMRTFYYKGESGGYFHIMMSVEGMEDFGIDDEKDIKMVLKNDPDTYMRIIQDKVIGAGQRRRQREEEEAAKAEAAEESNAEGTAGGNDAKSTGTAGGGSAENAQGGTAGAKTGQSAQTGNTGKAADKSANQADGQKVPAKEQNPAIPSNRQPIK